MNAQSKYSDSELKYHVWKIAIALPNAQYHTIVWFCNGQDAEYHLRALRRFIPKAKLVIFFDSPDSDLALKEVEPPITRSQVEPGNEIGRDRHLQNFHSSPRAVNSHALTFCQYTSSIGYIHNGRDAVLAGDDRTVRKTPTDFCN
jgi:hypothetical protein